MTENVKRLVYAFCSGRAKKDCADKITGEGLIAHWTYYSTEIAMIDKGLRELRLSSGGYRTVATKARLNAVLCVLAVGSIAQVKGEWFLSTRTGTVPWVDGTILHW